jgi:large subunit ribosomal protein L30
MAQKKLHIRQVRSSNSANRKQRGTLRSLGLGRIGKETERTDHPALRGQLAAIRHLVEVDGG